MATTEHLIKHTITLINQLNLCRSIFTVPAANAVQIQNICTYCKPCPLLNARRHALHTHAQTEDIQPLDRSDGSGPPCYNRI